MEQIGQNKMMAEVCRGLSMVCRLMLREEKKRITIEKGKLKMVEKHKMKGIIKSKVKKKIKDLNKFIDSFEKKSKVFEDFAKLHRVKEKEVKKEWKEVKKWEKTNLNQK